MWKLIFYFPRRVEDEQKMLINSMTSEPSFPLSTKTLSSQWQKSKNEWQKFWLKLRNVFLEKSRFETGLDTGLLMGEISQ